MCVDFSELANHVADFWKQVKEWENVSSDWCFFYYYDFNDHARRESCKIQMEELYQLCFFKSSGVNYSKKIIKCFIKTVKNVSKRQLNDFGIDKSLFCAINALSVSDEYLHTSKTWDWKHKSDHEAVKMSYFHVIKVFNSIDPEGVLNTVVKIIHGEKLWKWEGLCDSLIKAFTNCGIEKYKIVGVLLNKAESPTTSPKDTRVILRILYKILEDCTWNDDENTTDIINRFLSLYHDSLTDNSPRSIIFKKGLEICILNSIKHLPNSHLLSIVFNMSSWTLQHQFHNDEKILEFSNILQTAADLYKVDLLENPLQVELFSLLLKMISSTNPSVSLVGNRVLQNLLDRNKNKSQFQPIKIFFENTHYDIKINKHNNQDENFLKKHRETIHDSLVQSVMNHCSLRVNLESMYCTICLIIVEIPCGFTAAAVACLILNIQDLTLEQFDADRQVSYHVHAFVLSIMSLICWVHRAKVFYTYVNNILMERAQWAPHLNPPLALSYDFAAHHVLWDKPELFFIDWEVRFGLWKCFRLQSDENNEEID